MVQPMRVLAKKMANMRRNVRFYRLGDDCLRLSKAEAERRIDGDGADRDQGGDRREAVQDAALCSAILGSNPLAAVGSRIRLLQPATSVWASLWDYRAGRGARSGSRALPVTRESTNVQCRRDHRKRPLIVIVTFNG